MIFIVLPAVATNWIAGSAAENPFRWSIIDGILRVAAFFLYIWGIGQMSDIKRVFAYHGAEHKTIHAYEHDLPARAGAHPALRDAARALRHVVPADGHGRRHHRLLAVPGEGDRHVDGRHQPASASSLIAIVARLLLMPLVAGLAYEITVKWAGNHSENPFVKVLLWPGMQMQRMTTREPDDDMVEVAIAAMTPIIAREELEERRAKGEDEPALT